MKKPQWIAGARRGRGERYAVIDKDGQKWAETAIWQDAMRLMRSINRLLKSGQRHWGPYSVKRI